MLKFITTALNKINPIEAYKVFKKSDNQYMTKGIVKMGGSGTLITAGVGLIIDGSANENLYEIIPGAFLVIAGYLIGRSLSKNIENLKAQDSNEGEGGTNE